MSDYDQQAPPQNEPPHYPEPPQQAAAPSKDGKAVASLICGILSIILCPLLGLVAVILGHAARKRINDSGGTIGGGGMALAGLITGYLGLVLIFLALVAILAAVAIPKYQDLQKQARSKAMEGAFAAATSYSAMHLYKYLAEGGVEAEWRHVEQGVPLGDFNVDIDCTCGEQACLITIVNSPYGMDPRDYASGQSFGETYTLCD